MLLHVMFACTIAASTVSPLNGNVKLKALVASVRGFRKRSLPDWPEALAQADKLMLDLGYPEAKRTVRDLKWFMAVMETSFRDSDYVMRQIISSGGKLPGYVESVESAKSEFVACLDNISDKIRNLPPSFSAANPDVAVTLAQIVANVKSLKSILTKADIERQSHRTTLLINYSLAADKLGGLLSSIHEPLRGIAHSDMIQFFHSFHDYGVVMGVLHTAIGQSASHFLNMFEIDSHLANKFSKDYVVTLRFPIAMSYISDTLDVIVASLLKMTRLDKTPAQTTFEEIRRLHSLIKGLKSKVVSQHIGGEELWVPSCKAWRREQLRQVILTYQLASLV